MVSEKRSGDDAVIHYVKKAIDIGAMGLEVEFESGREHIFAIGEHSGVEIASLESRGKQARLKETAADPERFESTFADWTAMAEEQFLALTKVGIFPVKVLIDPDDFFAWCKETSQRNDASARAEYVSTRMRLAHKGNA